MNAMGLLAGTLAGASILLAPDALGSGDMCSASETREAESAVRSAEAAEKAGRTRDALRAALSLPRVIECAASGFKRRDALIERTSRKLGAEAEKAGRFGEAFDYYRTSYENGRADLDLADAHRALLRHVKSRTGDYKVVSTAAAWFEHHGNRASLAETRAIARASGEKALAAEERSFTASGASLRELEKAREWLELAGNAKAVNARAVQRGDALLARGAFSSVERAFQYYDFAGDAQKLAAARKRARGLGDEHAKNGQTRVAARFYELAGEDAKAAALERQEQARGEKAEAGRQEQFKKDQDDLEKKLGM